MAQGRPAIPSEVTRALLVEAGHRCAIPTCRAVAPLTYEHIVDWSEVQKHEFDNMIVLCRSCHGLKNEGTNADKLDRKALQQYKANLRTINNLYGGTEHHILEYFALNSNDAMLAYSFCAGRSL
jgi:cytochrome c553